MDKITFLNQLEIELDELPREQKDQIMYKYESMFLAEEQQGKTEQQIVTKMPEPQNIAKNFKAKSAISYAEFRPNLRNVVRAVMASLSLGVLSTLFILIPTLIVGMILMLILVMACVLTLTPIILMLVSLWRHIPDSLSNILFIFIVLALKLVNLIYRLIIKYLMWYIKTVKGSVQ